MPNKSIIDLGDVNITADGTESMNFGKTVGGSIMKLGDRVTADVPLQLKDGDPINDPEGGYHYIFFNSSGNLSIKDQNSNTTLLPQNGPIGTLGTIQIGTGNAGFTGNDGFKINTTGQMTIPDGTKTNPSLTFGNDLDTGLYRDVTGDNMAFTVGGEDVLSIGANGITFPPDSNSKVIQKGRAATGQGKDVVICAGAAANEADKDGGSLVLRSGISTGSGNSMIKLETYGFGPVAGGTADTSLMTRRVFMGQRNIPTGSTNTTVDLFKFDIDKLQYMSGSVDLEVFISDGDKVGTYSGQFNFTTSMRNNDNLQFRQRSSKSNQDNGYVIENVILQINPNTDVPGTKTIGANFVRDNAATPVTYVFSTSYILAGNVTNLDFISDAVLV